MLHAFCHEEPPIKPPGHFPHGTEMLPALQNRHGAQVLPPWPVPALQGSSLQLRKVAMPRAAEMTRRGRKRISCVVLGADCCAGEQVGAQRRGAGEPPVFI